MAADYGTYQLSEPSKCEGQSLENVIEVDDTDDMEKTAPLIALKSSGHHAKRRKTCTDKNAEHCKRSERGTMQVAKISNEPENQAPYGNALTSENPSDPELEFLQKTTQIEATLDHILQRKPIWIAMIKKPPHQ